MKILVFESDRFRPYLPDDCQVNPNVLGFELAIWLSKTLAERGLITSYPVSEDWGWFLEKTEGDSEYMICCSGNKTETASYEWRIFVKQHKRMFRRTQVQAEDALCDQLAAILRDEDLKVQVEEG